MKSEVLELQNNFAGSFWFVFVFIATVFFLAQHDLLHSVQLQTFGLSTVEMVITDTERGSLIRQISLFSIGGFGLFSLLRRKRNSLKPNGLLPFFIIFFLIWSILSLAWAEDTALTFRRVIILMMLSLGAIAIAERFSIREIMFLVFLCCGLYLVVGIFAEIVLGTFQPFKSGYRFCGTMDPNIGSWEIAILLITSVAFASSTERSRYIFWITAVVALGFLFLGRTRTTFAVSILALITYWGLVSPRFHKFIFVLSFGFVVCLLFFILGDQLISGAWDLILLGRRDETTVILTGRIPVWNECLSYIAKRPLLGYGYNAFWTPRHTIDISNLASWGAIGVPWALNGYIDLILGVGFVGAGIYLLMLALAIKGSIFLYKYSHNSMYAFVCATFVFYCLIMFLESICYDFGFPTFIVFTLLAKLGFGNLRVRRVQ